MATYVALGAEGCVYEGVRFSNFSIERVPTDVASITLTPSAGYGRYGFTNFPAYGVGFSLGFSPAFAAQSVGQQLANRSLQGLRFTASGSDVTPVRGVGLEVGAAITGTFYSSQEERYVTAHFYGSSPAGSLAAERCINFSCSGAGGYDLYPGPPFMSPLPGSLSTRLDVFMAASGYISTPPDAVHRVEVTNLRVAVFTAAPEPSMSALLGTGLLALGGVAARRRRPQA